MLSAAIDGFELLQSARPVPDNSSSEIIRDKKTGDSLQYGFIEVCASSHSTLNVC